MRVLSVLFSDKVLSKNSHHHHNHQLLFITEGEIAVTVGDAKYRARKGALLILSRLETHSIDVISPIYKRYAMEISAEPMPSAEKHALLYSVLVNRLRGFRHVVETEDAFLVFERIFAEMKKEFSAQLPFYEEKLSSLFLRLLIELYRIAPTLFYVEEGQNAALISAIREKLEADFAKPHTLAALATAYHISPSHLSHLFKNITGYAPVEYLMACRLSAAKQYLATTDYAISEIVAACGFSDNSNFCRMFKEKTGMSPSAFRRKYTNQ